MDNYCLDDDDVVFANGSINGQEARTYTASEMIQAIKKWAENTRGSDYIQECLHEGGEGKCLRVNSGWKRGKFRLRLEFIPETPDNASPLDDLRNDLNI